MNKCLHCGEPVKNKYCNVSCQNKHQNPLRKKERIIITKKCLKCGCEFNQEIIKGTKQTKTIRKYCSNSCSNSRTHSDETKKKISDMLTIKNDVRKCKLCGEDFECKRHLKRKFCSKSCSATYNNSLPHIKDKMRLAGLKSAQIQAKERRSKNEKYFAELCEQHFHNIKTNEPIFNNWDADVILLDEKIAVLWNGKWHYEKIGEKHSLKQVQNRDKIKIEEIKKCGYLPYIIKDMGKFNESFVEDEFKKLLKYLAN